MKNIRKRITTVKKEADQRDKTETEVTEVIVEAEEVVEAEVVKAKAMTT